jgi:hypothetical protein
MCVHALRQHGRPAVEPDLGGVGAAGRGGVGAKDSGGGGVHECWRRFGGVGEAAAEVYEMRASGSGGLGCRPWCGATSFPPPQLLERVGQPPWEQCALAGWSGDTVVDAMSTPKGGAGSGCQCGDSTAALDRRQRSRTAAAAIEAAVQVCTAGLCGDRGT